MKMKTLEEAIDREHSKFLRIEGRIKLKGQLKLEAYDDSPIDNTWVAEKEAEIPGLVTGLVPNHNFTVSPLEENKQIIMESMPSSTALKGGLLVAALMVIFKVISVINNNASFSGGSGGGGGGRGTASGTKTQLEQIKEQAEVVEENIDKTRNSVKAISPETLDEDSPAIVKLQLLNRDTRAIENNEFNPNGDVDPKKAIAGLDSIDYSFIYDLLKKAPAMLLFKDNSNLTGYINEAIKAVHVLKDLFGTYGSIEGFYDTLRDMGIKVEQAQSSEELNEPFAIMSKVEAIFSKYDDGSGPSGGSAEDIITYLKKENDYLKDHLDEITQPLTSDSVIIEKLYSIEEGRKDIQSNFKNLDHCFIFKNQEPICNFNETFNDEIASNTDAVLDSQLMSKISTSVNALDSRTTSVRESNINPELKNAKIELLNGLKFMGNIVSVGVYKPVSLFRTKTDKVTKFLDDLNSGLKKINDDANKVIEAANGDQI